MIKINPNFKNNLEEKHRKIVEIYFNAKIELKINFKQFKSKMLINQLKRKHT